MPWYIMYVITYQLWNYSSTMFVKWAIVNFVPEVEESKFKIHKLRSTRVTSHWLNYIYEEKWGGGGGGEGYIREINQNSYIYWLNC